MGEFITIRASEIVDKGFGGEWSALDTEEAAIELDAEIEALDAARQALKNKLHSKDIELAAEREKVRRLVECLNVIRDWHGRTWIDLGARWIKISEALATVSDITEPGPTEPVKPSARELHWQREERRINLAMNRGFIDDDLDDSIGESR